MIEKVKPLHGKVTLFGHHKIMKKDYQMQSRLYIYFSAIRITSCVLVYPLESGTADPEWFFIPRIPIKTVGGLKKLIMFSVIVFNFFA